MLESIEQLGRALLPWAAILSLVAMVVLGSFSPAKRIEKKEEKASRPQKSKTIVL